MLFKNHKEWLRWFCLVFFSATQSYLPYLLALKKETHKENKELAGCNKFRNLITQAFQN